MDALSIARALLALGISPVPIPHGKKGPTLPNWQRLGVTLENVVEYFNGGPLNVGMMMGPVSGGLVDVDLDSAEAVGLASYFLPQTYLVYGRRSKPKSHWLYTVAGHFDKPGYKFTDENNSTIVEIRLGGGGKGVQSVAPGSLHPSGEIYEWDSEGERSEVLLNDLLKPVKKIAIAAMLVKRWPEQNRHQACLILGGLLARCKWSVEEVGEFVVAVQEVAGVRNSSHVENGRKAATDAWEAHERGEQVYGFPSLKEFFGEQVGKQIGRYLELKEGDTEISWPIQNKKDFVANFTPPHYLIDGLIQRRFLYSLTGLTGHGKTSVALRIAFHIALGIPLAGRFVRKGRVLFLAGENPDDVRMRVMKMEEDFQLGDQQLDIWFVPGTYKLSNQDLKKIITAKTREIGPFDAVVVDTSVAFFEGDDENANAQMAAHARMLRELIELVDGRPAIIVTCHPTKNSSLDNLAPRGGSAFVNEVDGNLVVVAQLGRSVVELHWQIKLRGPDFAPIHFEIKAGTTEKLRDADGKSLWTVTASPISEEEKTDMEEVSTKEENALLKVIAAHPGASLADLAERAGWSYESSGLPNKSKVNRTLQELQRSGLIVKNRHQFVLTKRAETILKRLSDGIVSTDCAEPF